MPKGVGYGIGATAIGRRAALMANDKKKIFKKVPMATQSTETSNGKSQSAQNIENRREAEKTPEGLTRPAGSALREMFTKKK